MVGIITGALICWEHMDKDYIKRTTDFMEDCLQREQLHEAKIRDEWFAYRDKKVEYTQEIVEAMSKDNK